LKSRTDDAFLLRFLRARKFDYDRAYNLLINYYTIRASNADVIGHVTPSVVEPLYDTGAVTVLPHRDKEGRKIIYFHAGTLHMHCVSYIIDNSLRHCTCMISVR